MPGPDPNPCRQPARAPAAPTATPSHPGKRAFPAPKSAGGAPCYRSRYAFKSITAPDARRAVLGQAYFSKDRVKQEVIAYCRRRGLKVRDHHAADAAIIWLWHRGAMRGDRPVAGPLFREMRS